MYFKPDCMTKALHWIARFISFVFHPIFMVCYMLGLLLLVNPQLFGYSRWNQNLSLLILVFVSTVVIPGIAISMMRPLGFIQSLKMEEKKERIIPLIVVMIFYLWLFINFYKNKNIPFPLTTILLGVIIGLFLSFFITVFSKISIHAVGAGGLLGMLILTRLFFSYESFIWPVGAGSMISTDLLLLVAIIIAGMIGTSRLILESHHPGQVWGGYLIGLSSMMLAYTLLH